MSAMQRRKIEAPNPLEFFALLKWLDGRPLVDTIEPYRAKLFTEALYTFGADGRLRYNLVLSGKAKKNWKSADLVLACFYRFFAWPNPGDAYLLANDEDQAGDDLGLAKKLIEKNPVLAREVDVQAKEIRRRDNRGILRILPSRDVKGAHGKTFSFIGFDEIHGYRNWDILEALAPDPTRHDVLQWITSYASIYNSPGAPLYDLFKAGQNGSDPGMLFSWYAADFTTDDELADADPEVKANPSMASWDNPGYLAQQKRRLPTHRYRRLHLNLPGTPDGAFYDAAKVMDAIVSGRKSLPPQSGIKYHGFVDMSGGSSDDACLGIAHEEDGRTILDLVEKQTGKAPFNPRHAVLKFATILKRYGISSIQGDAYAGETFRSDFEDAGVLYEKCKDSKSDLYEALEPRLNAGEIELLDHPVLQEQLLTLVMRGAKVDHQPGDHDDFANAAAGALDAATESRSGYDLYKLIYGERWQDHSPGKTTRRPVIEALRQAGIPLNDT
jgi:hypothetical protein